MIPPRGIQNFRRQKRQNLLLIEIKTLFLGEDKNRKNSNGIPWDHHRMTPTRGIKNLEIKNGKKPAVNSNQKKLSIGKDKEKVTKLGPHRGHWDKIYVSKIKEKPSSQLPPCK